MEKHHYLPFGDIIVIILVQQLRCGNLYEGDKFNWKDCDFL